MRLSLIVKHLIVAMIVCTLCASSEAAENNTPRYPKATVQQLVSQQSKFDGKIVAVYGHLLMKQAEAMALSTEGCGTGNESTHMAVAIELAPPRVPYSEKAQDAVFDRFKRYSVLDGRCVWVVGRYDSSYSAGMGKTPGSLRDIRAIYRSKQ